MVLSIKSMQCCLKAVVSISELEFFTARFCKGIFYDTTTCHFQELSWVCREGTAMLHEYFLQELQLGFLKKTELQINCKFLSKYISSGMRRKLNLL